MNWSVHTTDLVYERYMFSIHVFQTPLKGAEISAFQVHLVIEKKIFVKEVPLNTKLSFCNLFPSVTRLLWRLTLVYRILYTVASSHTT